MTLKQGSVVNTSWLEQKEMKEVKINQGAQQIK